jgi:putative transposase
MHAELRAKGISACKKRVERLMRERGVYVCTNQYFRCTTDARHSLPIVPDLRARNF